MVMSPSTPFGVLPFGKAFRQSAEMRDAPAPNEAADNRRRQLRKWIADRFGNSQTAFIGSTADGERQLNQGELSGLLRNKSFGEKRARSLERQAGMPPGYLDELEAGIGQESIAGDQHRVAAPTGQSSVVPIGKLAWPFKQVTYRRLMALRSALGPKLGADALRDIDELLDVAVTKWERLATSKKKPPQNG